ncbi:MAG TPA: SPOR domain-containing protein [Bacteroidota bacterium]|nr:SPOR domain-containing protein [Bacteroidota bacterium]
MRTPTLLLVSLLSLPTVRASDFKPSPADVQISVLTLTPLEVNPGSIVALSLKVSNTSSRSTHIEPTIALPQYWRLLTREAPFDLGEGQEELRLISVSIPATTPAGEFQIVYAIRVSGSAQAISVSIPLRVKTVLQVDVQVLETPKFVNAGSSFYTSFLVTNTGNARSRFFLKIRSSLGWSVTLDHPSFELHTREGQQIIASVKTDDALSLKVPHVLELEIFAEGDSIARGRVFASTEIIPRPAGSEALYHELPLQARVRGLSDGRTYFQQYELTGSGSFSERKTDRIDFLFRLPQTQPRSILGLRDEYRVRYQTAGLEVYAGDWGYTLSPLTEFGRLATGAGGQVNMSGFSIGGYYNQTRWFQPKQEQIAGFLTYEPHQSAQFALNYLRREDQTTSDVGSVRVNVRPLGDLLADVEYAVSKSGSTTDQAYSLRARGIHSWLRYDLHHVNAGARYTGYYRDLRFTSVNATVFPVQRVRIEASFRSEARNLKGDTSLHFGPRTEFYQVGVGFLNLASLHYRSSAQEDLLAFAPYKRREEVVQLRLSQKFSSLDMFVSLDRGITRDLLTSNRFPADRYALFSTFSPSSVQNYTLSIDYATEQSPFTSQEQRRLSGNFSAWLLLWQATQMQMTVYRSQILSPVKQQFSTIDASVEHLFPFHHRLIFRIRQNVFDQATERDRGYSLEYVVPIGVPVKRLSSTGILKGKVLDEEGRPLSGVLLNAGPSAAMTERDGSFTFPPLSPGPVYLILDKSSIGLDKVPLQSLPMEIPIRGGDESSIELRIVRSGTIRGRVSLFAFPEGMKEGDSVRYVAAGGHTGMALELSNGIEIHRRVSDSRGQFVFADLRPGVWTLKAFDYSLPANHLIERDTFRVELKPGTQADLDIRVLPQRRTIRVIEEGTIIQQEQPRQPPPAQSDCFIIPLSDQSGFLLQISSWQTRTKAESIARIAKEKSKFDSSIERANVRGLGPRYRVHLGTFKTQAEAEAMCQFLRQFEELR